MEAGCRSRFGLRWRAHDHGAPNRAHDCGIYACREREDAERLIDQLDGRGRLPTAIGRVSLWGRVIENTGGWRAQFAYPYAIELMAGESDLAARLRRRYGVDVSMGAT
jgi:hypothetical protein